MSVVALAALLNGCVLPSPIERHDATRDQQSGYVSSAARTRSAYGYVLHLKNTATDATYALQINSGFPIERVFDGPDTPPQINMIKVPPGNYTLTGWSAYEWGTHMKRIEKKFDALSAFAEPFSVAPGAVVFLGDFVTDDQVTRRSLSYATVHYKIIPQPIGVDVARDEFVNAYPTFKEASFTCRFCSFDESAGRRTFRFTAP
ncbi:hypothetical protein [Burkholderia sp. LMG 21824]|uniref:hypothetical protein n=1 Tax=Burkholderia sp. LMG 21824 TaxID=3158172 RepID=UPI003C2C8C58